MFFFAGCYYTTHSTHQYSVTVNDSVEPVSNSEDCALLKLVPDGLLDEAVSSRAAENTTPEHKNSLHIQPWAGILLNAEQWRQRGWCSSRRKK